MRAIGPMQRPDDAASLLALYLRDHDGASAGGVRLVERCRHSNAGTSFAAPLADLAVEITQDQAQLRGIMHDLDITPSRVKRTAAWVAANLGELVPNAAEPCSGTGGAVVGGDGKAAPVARARRAGVT